MSGSSFRSAPNKSNSLATSSSTVTALGLGDLVGLPYEVLLIVAEFLDIESLLALYTASKEWCGMLDTRGPVWRHLAERLGAKQEDTERNLVSVCRDTLYRRPVDKIGITWGGDTRYWSIEDSEESLFGKVAILLHVCWLDAATTLTALPAGLYDVRWRIRLDRPCLDDLEFRVETKNSLICAMLTNDLQQKLADQHNDGWFYLTVARVTVGDNGGSSSGQQVASNDYNDGDMNCRFWCHSGTWKSGLSLDFVEVQPVRFINGEPVKYNGLQVAGK